MSEPLHSRLRAEHHAIAERCLETAFVRGLADGTLDPEAFKRYVAQDAFFLRAFFSAYALAAAKTAGRPDTARGLHALMQGVLDELELHESYASSLDIDLEAVDPDPAASAYTDFLLRTAWSAEVGEILAAMTPCMRLYAWIGQRLSDRDHSGNPYRDWVETYASDDFEALAAELERLLDELAPNADRADSAYGYAMRCELDFFEAFSRRA